MDIESKFMSEVAQIELSELAKILEELDEKKEALETQRKRMEALVRIFEACHGNPLFWMNEEPTVIPSFIDGGVDDSPTEIVDTPTESKSE